MNRNRFDLEQARLQLDRANWQNEQTRVYLEQWRTDIQPVHEHRILTRQQAHSFAKVGLQSRFVINGGALVAFPAFAAMIGTAFNANFATALISICSFCAGQVSATATALIGYLSMAADGNAVEHREEIAKLGTNIQRASETQKKDLLERHSHHETSQKNTLTEAVFWPELDSCLVSCHR